MARRFTEDQIVIASHNQGKVREIDALLKPFGILVSSAVERSLEEPEETGATFVENAILKAEAATLASGLPALADDSGLAVDALGGDPGIYSARWAGPEKDFAMAMQKIETLLRGIENRKARFVCALALAWPDGETVAFEGIVEGTLVWPVRGTRGFGYDPMFVPAGRSLTFGEMDQKEKHEISHRADAFRQLVAACFAY
jgi:XTP/dITP diphosphohydrolase